MVEKQQIFQKIIYNLIYKGEWGWEKERKLNYIFLKFLKIKL